MLRLQDKIAIITGGASGIGLAACERFVEEGAQVILADLNDQEGTKQAERLQEKGYQVHFIRVDIANRAEIDNLVEEVMNTYGKIDILINNAGMTDDATLLKMEPDQFQRVIDVNVTGLFHFTQLVVPHMIQQRSGKIINTSSVSGVYGNFGQTNYAATKAAVVGMTKTWAKEFGRKGINVNAVAPGFTATDMVKKMPAKVIDQMEENISLHRLGKPEDIANAYLFLASEEASYVHGHVLHVDGGIIM